MMNNRRMYRRFDYQERNIEIMITTSENKAYSARLCDISRGGISFYSDEPNLMNSRSKVMDVSLSIDGTMFSLSVEMLRGSGDIFETFYAGRFIGVSSLLYNAIFVLLRNRMALKEPVLV